MSYKAFLSYSHAADDQLAPAIQGALHRFAKPFYRLRAIRVFRDKTSLHLTPELWPEIQQALSESEYFIMMASPDAAASPWVQQEADEWLRLRNDSTKEFLIILTAGEIKWDKSTGDFDWNTTTALPDNLHGVFKTEPFFLDLRWAKKETGLTLRHPNFLDHIVTLAAKLHGQPKDVMSGIDVRQHRLFKIAVSVVIGLLLIFLCGALGGLYDANVQRRHANTLRKYAEDRRDEADDARRKAEEEALNAKRSRRREKRERLKAVEAKKNETKQRKRAEVATIRAEERRKEAERQTRRAVAGQFAAHAQANLEKNPKLSLLSAIEAVNTTSDHDEPTVRAAEQSLRLALAKFGKGSVIVAPDDTTTQPSTGANEETDRCDPSKPGGENPAQSSDAGIDRRLFSPDMRWAIDQESSPPILADLSDKMSPVRYQMTITEHSAKDRQVSFSDDSHWAVMATDDQTIRILDLKSQNPAGGARTISRFNGRVPEIFFDTNCQWLVIVSRDDGNACLYDVSKGYAADKSYPFSVHKSFALNLKFIGDGCCLPFVNDSGMVQLFDLCAENQVIKARDLYRINTGFLKAGESLDVGFIFSQDGRWLAVKQSGEAIQETAGPSVGNNVIGLWDRRDKQLHLLKGHKYWVKWLRFSGDGNWLFSSNVPTAEQDDEDTLGQQAQKDGSKAILWDLRAKSPEGHHYKLQGHKDWVQIFAFSRNGHWLFTASEKGQLWDLFAKDPAAHPRELPGFKGGLSVDLPAEFISNDNWLMVTGVLGVDMWDLRYPTPKLLPVRQSGLENPSESPIVSPNGRWMAKIHKGGTVLLWDLTTENPSANQLSISGLEENIQEVSFSPDSHWMITIGPDNHRQFSNLDVSDMMAQAALEAGRNFTWEEWVQLSPESSYRKTIAGMPVESHVIEGMVDQVQALLSRGDRAGAYSAYKNMAEWAIKQDDAMLCTYVCLCGSTDGFAAVVLAAGERAVELEKGNHYFRDALGLARALTGDYSGAVRDFRAYVDWIKGDAAFGPHVQLREKWIAKLGAKRNPFNNRSLLEARSQMLTIYQIEKAEKEQLQH